MNTLTFQNTLKRLDRELLMDAKTITASQKRTYRLVKLKLLELRNIVEELNDSLESKETLEKSEIELSAGALFLGDGFKL